jgi:hypothetical protein
VLLSLIQHVENNPSEGQPQVSQRARPVQQEYQGDPTQFQLRATRITHHNRDQRELRENISTINANNEEKLKQLEEIRLVAKFFCETGINVKLVQHFFPDM